MRDTKERLYRFLEPSRPIEGRWEKAFDWFILALIMLSVGAVVLRTVEGVAEDYGPYLRGFQVFVTVVFTAEYLLRLYSCTAAEGHSRPLWGRVRFVLSPMSIVDLLAVAPFYLGVFLAPGASGAGATLMLRMLRLLKVFRYSRSLKIFARVLREKADQLLAAFLATGVLLVFSSSLVYFAETGAQPDAFSSIPAAMWWGIVTLTTVGYGDVSPVTPLGRLFGAITAVVGIGIVALPSGILAGGFIEGFAEDRRRSGEGQAEEGRGEPGEERCPRCGRRLR